MNTETAPRTNEQTAAKAMYDKWLSAVQRAEKERENFRTRGKEIIKRYRNEAQKSLSSNAIGSYNLFWANVETKIPALYNQTPTPAVGRRFYDNDPVARLASQLLERTLMVQLDCFDFDQVMEQAVKDVVLPGLGQMWVEYEPKMVEMPPAPQADAGGEQKPPELAKAYEYTRCRYVPWTDYLEGPARVYDEVPWVCKIEYMSREELLNLPGVDPDVAENVQLDCKTIGDGMVTGVATVMQVDDGTGDKAKVYDIWDKDTKTQILVATGYTAAPLRVMDDPLHLKGFFPCPRPIMSTTTNDTRIPVPDYVLYQTQLNEIDTLTKRINILTKTLKLAGVYNGSGGNVKMDTLLTSSDNKMIAVDQWAAFAEKGGVRGNMEFLPVEEVARVVQNLISLRSTLKADVAELTGLSDLVRGQTNPNETLGAQQLKSQFAGRRISKQQKDVARFARDGFRLMGEVIVEMFSPEMIFEMSGARYLPDAVVQTPAMPGQPPLPPQPSPMFQEAVALLKSDTERTIRVDIESDSTMAPDENAEKQRRTEFLTAVGGFMNQAMEIAAKAPEMMPLLGEMLMFGARGFRVGRSLENVMEQTLTKMQQKQAQPAPPQPDPEMVKAQQEMQLQQMQTQGDLENDRMKTMGQLANDRMKIEGQLTLQAQKQRGEMAMRAAQPAPPPGMPA